jgi:pimeloyl-ACP methyl ester carboxylesterase
MKTRPLRSLPGLACLLILAAAAWFVFDRLKQPVRPQTPAAPLPYEVRQVAFDNAAIGLEGTLTLPRTPGPHPAIVLIPGSGEVDRDGSLFGHHFYLVLADDLTRRGFAVLRSDKRGIGRSGGDFASATSLDFASDIQAGLAFLRARPDIDANRIGLIGHSEGGLIGSMVAAKAPGTAFLVLMAANGLPAREMLLSRTRRQMGQGAPGRLEQELALQQAVFAAVAAPRGDSERKAAVRSLYLAAQSEHGRAFSEDEFAPFLTPWMRTLLRIDPEPLMRQIDCPVLALVGDKDQVVSANDNIPALRRALAGNPRAQVYRLPGLNHFFQGARTGDLSEVAAIEETISPRALALIGSWAVQQSNRQPGAASP